MSELLTAGAIRLNEAAPDRDAAIRCCGRVLNEIGATEKAYTQAMLQREESISTYVGEGVAIPHGTFESKQLVNRDSLAVVRFSSDVDWSGDAVRVCVAIAATGERHVELLSRLAEILLDSQAATSLRHAHDPSEVLQLLSTVRKDAAT